MRRRCRGCGPRRSWCARAARAAATGPKPSPTDPPSPEHERDDVVGHGGEAVDAAAADAGDAHRLPGAGLGDHALGGVHEVGLDLERRPGGVRRPHERGGAGGVRRRHRRAAHAQTAAAGPRRRRQHVDAGRRDVGLEVAVGRRAAAGGEGGRGVAGGGVVEGGVAGGARTVAGAPGDGHAAAGRERGADGVGARVLDQGDRQGRRARDAVDLRGRGRAAEQQPGGAGAGRLRGPVGRGAGRRRAVDPAHQGDLARDACGVGRRVGGPQPSASLDCRSTTSPRRRRPGGQRVAGTRSRAG